MFLQAALKEWTVAVDALLAGKTVLLLRKGGIREEKGRFTLKTQRVLLFPTLEHQRLELLKPDALTPTIEQPETKVTPTRIQFRGWAEITHIVSTLNGAAVARVFPWHVWNQQFVARRLQWKPKRPLYLLLLRSQQLTQPVSLPYRPEYRGCRSWITLDQPVDITNSAPVLTATDYANQVAQIKEALRAEGAQMQEIVSEVMKG